MIPIMVAPTKEEIEDVVRSRSAQFNFEQGRLKPLTSNFEIGGAKFRLAFFLFGETQIDDIQIVLQEV